MGQKDVNPPSVENEAGAESRVEHHLETALDLADDEEVQYHLREAIHLLKA